MTSNIPQLPAELIHEIAAQVEDVPALAALSLVSRTWNSASTKLLYSCDLQLLFGWDGLAVDHKQSRVGQLERTLLARPDLAVLSKSLFIDAVDLHTAGAEIDMDAAVRVLRNILAVGTSITTFYIDEDTDWITTATFLNVLSTSPNAQQRLKFLHVGSRPPHPGDLTLIHLLRELPSLTSLSVVELDPAPNAHRFPPPFALQHLAVTDPLQNHALNFLQNSRASLKSIEFTVPHEDPPPDFTLFTNLHHVDFYFSLDDDNGLLERTTSSLVAAKELYLHDFAYEEQSIAPGRTLRFLDSIPASVEELDLGNWDTVGGVNVVAWLLKDPESKEQSKLRKILFAPREIFDATGDSIRTVELQCAEKGIECVWSAPGPEDARRLDVE